MMGTRVNWSSENGQKERDDVRRREKLIIWSLCVTTLAAARLNQMPSFEREDQSAWHRTVRGTLDLSYSIHFHIHQPSPFSAFH